MARESGNGYLKKKSSASSSSSAGAGVSVAAHEHGTRLTCFLPRRRFSAIHSASSTSPADKAKSHGGGWIRMRTLKLHLRRKKRHESDHKASKPKANKPKNPMNPMNPMCTSSTSSQSSLEVSDHNEDKVWAEDHDEVEGDESEDEDEEEEEEEEEVVMVDRGEEDKDKEHLMDPTTCRCPVKRSCCSFDKDSKSLSDWMAMWQQRERKWMAKFEAKDWHLDPRVCRKWKHASELETTAVVGSHGDEAALAGDAKDGVTFRVKTGLSNFASAAENLLVARQFESLIRSGVPSALRGQVWWLCSDAARKRQTGPESYATLVQRANGGLLNDRVANEIEKDLHRTFPRDDSQEEARMRREQHTNELRRVLRAYSLRNPSIGYCQSMNFLVAVLLSFMHEEEAFWVLCATMEDLIPEFHSCSMSGSRGEQRVFMEVLQAKMPDIAHHLQVLGVQMEPLTLKWFLCLFLNSLPLECVLRIWDVFFYEGSHVLLRVALVLMKLMHTQLLACEEAFDVYELLRFTSASLKPLLVPFRTGILNRDEVLGDTLIRLAMEKSFLGVIALDSLQELRRFHQNAVRQEYEQDEKERRKHLERRSSSARKPRSATNTDAGGNGNGNGGDPKIDDDTSEDYDLVDEFLESGQCEISPLRYIRFCDLYRDDGQSAEDTFVNVMFDKRSVRAHG